MTSSRSAGGRRVPAMITGAASAMPPSRGQKELWDGFFGAPAIDRPDAAALMVEGGRGLLD